MSASEKLKALAERTDTGTTLNYGRVAALNELEAVLPRIVAVVEAAEDVPELGEDNYLLTDLRTALTALEEALS